MARQHLETLRWLSFALWLSPALLLAADWLGGTLGVNPLQQLLHGTGRWAEIMLLVTLAVTPLRRLSVWVSQTAHARYGKRVSDWNWLIRLRRQFGLFAFFYGALHGLLYLGLDVGFDWPALRDDVLQRPTIAAGLLSLGLMLPLAATSNQRAMRGLGGAWRRLHLLTYPVACLALLHEWLHAKPGQTGALPYTLCLIVLLAARVVAWRLGDRGTSGEVRERERGAHRAPRPSRAAPL